MSEPINEVRSGKSVRSFYPFRGSGGQGTSNRSLIAIAGGILASIGLLLANPSSAQWTPPGGGGGGTVSEPNLFEGSEAYRQTVGQSASLPSVEFGDSWNHDTGEISFSLTDLSIPGNSGLPVSMTRTRARSQIAYRSSGMLADWELSLPRVEYTWRQNLSFWEGTRCSNPKPAQTYSSGSTQWKPAYFHFGMSISGLDGSSEMLLDPYVTWPTSALGAAPALTTKSLWRVSCLPNATNGHEGFLATSPDGTTYRFDREIHRRGIKNYNGAAVTHIQVSVYPSTITDVHGNTLTYTYGAHGPTKIQANDGRIINFAYNSAGHITSISANSRTWTYHYQTRHGRPFLHRVVQPDGKQWRYEGFESLDWANFTERDYLDCVLLASPWGGIGWRPGYNLEDIEVVHPNGTRLEVTFDLIKNGRTKNTPRTTPNYWFSNRCRQSVEHLDNHVVSMAVAEKRIVQASGATDTWTYTYGEDEGSYSNQPAVLPDTKLRTEILPDGTRREYDVYRVANNRLEGEVFETRAYNTASGGAPIEVRTNNFGMAGFSWAAGQDTFPDSYGAPTGTSILKGVFQSLIESSVIKRGVDTYTTSYGYTLSGTSFALNNPTTVTKSSNVGGGTRSSTITYQNRTSPWVLFLPHKEVVNGAEVIRLDYSSLGDVTHVRRYGALKGTFGWNADGTMAWSRDALNRQTTYSSYKRGQPQTVTQPDGTSYSFVIDNNGWVTSATNPRGHTTTISHNSMGWLTAVNRPTGWSDTSVSYTWGANGITITETTGTKRVVTTHDGLNRPTLVRRDDLTGVAASVYQKMEYDGLGRVVFESYPSESSNPTTGMTMTYDGLGRSTQSAENVAPFATTTTAYLSGNRVRVTDPSGNQTTTTSVGFGAPDDGYVTHIAQPQGVTTAMSYDVRGNLLSATQSGGGVSSTQTWAYDSQYRVCAHTTPETGTKRFQYDAADQIIAYAEGLSGSACSSLPSSKTQMTYDQMGRITLSNFSGSTPDIAKTYDANGNVTSVSRGGVNWTYSYNNGDLLTQERLQLDGRTYQFDYTYDGEGDLVSASVPWAGTVAYNPDGFGRATGLSIGSSVIASNGRYFANGDLKQMSYGNGYAYSATQNARQLIASAQTVDGSVLAVKRNYSHDASGRITSIIDFAVSGENRSFTYDGMGRLKTASGPWGAGSYTYDALGNLKSWTQGSRTHTTVWDTAKNRPTSATTTGYGTRGISYDSKGNVTTLGGMSFTYDQANQPVAVSGTANGSYTYDGNLKRVKQVVNGETIYNVYSAVTGSIAIVDNSTTGERNVILEAGSASVRWNPSSGAEITHHDHLGSPIVATDWQGGIMWRESYTPFGEKLTDPAANRNKPSFTGHIDDGATGLTYMQARYYDPAMGRFLSSDPVGFMDGGPDYFNRYAYVNNNPISAVDPTGMYKCVGNRRDCDDLRRYYETLVEASQSERIDEDVKKHISAVLDHIGAPGKGTLEISFISFDESNTVADADPDTGNIRIDLNKIEGVGEDFRGSLPAGNRSRATAIAGAAVLMHEGIHSMQIAAGWDFSDVDTRYRAEIVAYVFQHVTVVAFGGTNVGRKPGAGWRDFVTEGAYRSCVGTGTSRLAACDTAAINWRRNRD